MRKEHFTWHHRRPRFLGGTSEARNMVELPQHLHQAWHDLFKAYTPEQIAATITRFYLDPDYIMVAVKKSDRKIIEEGIHLSTDILF